MVSQLAIRGNNGHSGDFMFGLSKEESQILIFQSAISKKQPGSGQVDPLYLIKKLEVTNCDIQ